MIILGLICSCLLLVLVTQVFFKYDDFEYDYSLDNTDTCTIEDYRTADRLANTLVAE